MRWKKLGLVFRPPSNLDWWQSHAQAPSAVLLNSSTIRVFVGAWDKSRISRIGFVDLDAQNPLNIKRVSKSPVVDLGRPGTFDDNGVFPAVASNINGEIFLYYTGFQLVDKIRYYMFGGLAVSKDGSDTFIKVSEVPVMDRSDEGLYFRGGPSVIYENNKFKAFYSAGSSWVEVGGKMRPEYDIYYTESKDGINFPKEDTLCLRYDRSSEHGLGRPQIVKEDGIYKLYYTVRTLDMKYKSGYAESEDGINWKRKDVNFGLVQGNDGWDSEMVYFPNVVKVDDRKYLFYNGNNYGEEGFGCALLQEE